MSTSPRRRSPLNRWVRPEPRPQTIRRCEPRLGIEVLEDRAVPATLTWIGGNGDWGTVANWQVDADPTSHRFPAAADDVVIPGGVTVSHAGQRNDTIHSLSIAAGGTLNHYQSALTVNGAYSGGGTFNVEYDCTLNNVAVAAGSTLTVTNASSNTLVGGVTVAGTLQMNDSVRFTNLTLNGGAVNLSGGDLRFAGAETLGGNGTVTFASSINHNLALFAGADLTIAPGVTIHTLAGANGTIGSANATVHNQGTVQVDGAGSSVTFAGGTAANPWANTGTVWVSAATGTLNLAVTTTTAGLGSISHTGGTVNFQGTINNAGNTLLIDSTRGAWNFSGGTANTVTGGTLQTTGSGRVTLYNYTLSGVTVAPGTTVYTQYAGTDYGTCQTLNGVTLQGTLDLASQTGGNPLSYVWFVNDLTLDGGTVNLGNAAGTTYGGLRAAATEHLKATAAGGTVVFGGEANNLGASDNELSVTSNATLSIDAGVTVRGKSGNIGQLDRTFSTNNSVVNRGVIDADTAGGVFTLTGGTAAAPWDNSGGTIRLSSASTLNLNVTTTTPDLGTIAHQAGTLNFGGTLDNSNATLAIDSSQGTWNFNAGAVTGGTLTSSGTGGIVLRAVTLSNLSLPAGNPIAVKGSALFDTDKVGTTLNLTNNFWTYFAGTLTLDGGTVNIGDSAGNSSLFVVSPTTNGGQAGTITGAGSVVFSTNTANGLGVNQSNASFTIDPNVTVRGAAGAIGNVSGSAIPTSFTNKGTIKATGGGTIQTRGAWTNAGTVWAAGGVIDAASSAIAPTNLAAGTLTGGTWEADASSSLYLTGGVTTNAATVILNGTTANFVAGTGSASAFAALAANAGSLTVTGGRALATTAGLSNSGTLTIGASSVLTTGGFTQTAGGVLNTVFQSTTSVPLVVTGAVSLGGAYNPSFASGFTPPAASTLKAIDNDATDAVGGAFAGLPQNGPLTVNGVPLRINYAGGTGNDVVLTAGNHPPAVAADHTGVTANEGGTATNTGTFADVEGTGTVTLSVDGGTIIQNNVTGTWSWSTPAPDGPAGPFTVTVTATDDQGAVTTTAFTYSVLNVAPTVALGGAAAVNEGSVYTLSLGAVIDPGQDTLTRYTIDWGDGTTPDSFTGGPANTTATHTYANGPASPTITVRGTDEDGTYTLGTKAVQVLNVPPTLTIAGPPAVYEASTYTLTLAASDPGADSIGHWTVNWGDGIIQTVAGNPASATHVYALAPNDYTITAAATDADGTYAAPQSVPVNVRVAPRVSIDDVTTPEGNAGETHAVTFRVTLDRAISDPVTVNYAAVAAGSATANTDFLPVAGTLTFAPGETAKTVSVTVVGDSVMEQDETFAVELSGPTNAILYDNFGLGTIADDDVQAVNPFPAAPTNPLDVTWNGTGVLTYPFPNDSYLPLGAAATLSDPDGRVVQIAGYGSAGQLMAARLNPNGTFDATFGANGIASFALPGMALEGSAGAVYQDGPNRGKVLVAGARSIGGDRDFLVARFNVDGTLDTSFGHGLGYATASWSIWDQPNAVAIDAAGRIVLAGTFDDGGLSALLAARFNPDGTPDPTFAANGQLSYRVSYTGVSYTDAAAATKPDEATGASRLLIDADGKLLFAGFTGMPGTDLSVYAAREGGGFVARFNADGTLDTTFGNDPLHPAAGGSGVTFLPVAIGNRTAAQVNGLALQPDGKIVAVESTFGGYGQVLVARLTADGRLDPDFSLAGSNTDPTVFARLPGIRHDFTGQATAYGVAVTPDGKILVGGGTNNNNTLFAARYNGDGTPDTTFDVAGHDASLAPVGGVAFQATVLPDGNYLLGGVSSLTGNQAEAVKLAAARSDLSVGATADTGTVSPAGGRVTFAIRVQTALAAAAFPSIRYVLPAGVTFVSATSADGSWAFSTPAAGANGTVVATRRGLSPSDGPQDITLTVDISAGAVGPNGLTNTVVAVSATLDPDSANNTATVVINPSLRSISGAASVQEGGTYSLSLSATDAAAIDHWTINWGDGNTQTVSGSPAAVTHVYDDGPHAYTIIATATSGGVTTPVGTTVAVAVSNVAPTADLSGPGAIIYGSAGSFHLASAFDPSAADSASLRFSFAATEAGLAGYADSSPASSYVASSQPGVGTYTVWARVIDKDGGFTDYSLSYTVTPATLAVTADPKTKVFGQPDPALTYTVTGLQFQDTAATVLTGAPARVAGANVGSYDITPGTLAATANYKLAFVANSLTITPAALIVTADNQSRVYGRANPTLTATITGFVNGDTAAVVTGSPALATSATSASGVGSYVITTAIGSLSGANYAFSFVSGTLAVTPAMLTVTADNKTRVYGQPNPTLTATIAGFVNGDTAGVVSGSPALSAAASGSSGVGSYPITAAVGSLSAANYTFTLADGALIVTPALLTVAADNQTRQYGRANPTLTATIAGFVNGDVPGAVTGVPTLTTAATSASGVGTYGIIAGLGTLAAANYTFALVDGTLAVTPATLTVSADNKTRVYGQPNPAFTYAVTGFVNGDTAAVVDGVPTLSATATSASGVGSYPITAGVGSLAAANYTFSFVSGALAVTPAALTVTAQNAAKVYGQPNPTFAYAIAGFVNGDSAAVVTGTPALTTTATATSGVGTYPISPSLGSLSAANYAFALADGTLAITPAALTVTAQDAAKVYGQDNPAFGVQYGGFVNGDGPTALVGTLTVTTPANARSHAGTYPVTPSGLTGDNYTIEFTPGTLTVTPAVLTVVPDGLTKVYGAAVPPLTYTLAGFVNGDTAAVVTGAPNLSTAAAAGSPVGSYLILGSPGTLAAHDYTFALVNGTLAVTPAVLTVSAANRARVYGQPNPAFTFAVTGFVNGDTSGVVSGSPALTTTATAASGVGTYPISPSLGSLSAANYAFTFVSGSLAVTPATLTVAAQNATKEYGQSNPTLAYQIIGFVNGDASGVVSGSPALSTTATSASGVGSYPITAGVGSLAAANYTFALVDGTLAVTPATLAVSADNKTRVYGQPNPTLTYAVTGFVSGDTAAAVGGSPILSTIATATSGVGTYPIAVSLGSLSAANYTFRPVNGVLTVTQATPTITWPTPAQIAAGTPLSSAQLNAVASVPGTFAYTPPAGTVLAPGTQILTATFTPTDSADYATASASVSIVVSAGVGGRAIILDPTASGALTMTGNGQFDLPLSVVVDSNSRTAIVAAGNATLTANSLQEVGGYRITGNAKLDPSPTHLSQPLADPYATLPVPAAGPARGRVSLGGDTSATISPGVYTSVSVSGNARLTMSPGVYVIAGGGVSVSGNGSVSGDGVMIYNAGSNYPAAGGCFGDVSVTGNGKVALSPVTTGTYAGLLIFQSRDNRTPLTFAGNGISITSGVVYDPAAELRLGGNGKFTASIVTDTLTLTGNAACNAAGPGDEGLAYSPVQVRTAYGFDAAGLDGAGQTIAIVDAYDNPLIGQSLDAFDAHFGLSAGGPTLLDLYGPASSFLTVVGADGGEILPGLDPAGPGVSNWETEEALDVEWVHAAAPGAKIVLVEAASPSLDDLMSAVRVAAGLPGVSVVSMSWGFLEGLGVVAADEARYDGYLTTPAGHAGVTFVASTGDLGAAVPQYPAYSPNVVAVGGTSLYLNGDGSYGGETGWGSAGNGSGVFLGGGGGFSQFEAEPDYQRGVQGTGFRSTPDVSFDADPNTGAWVADAFNLSGDDPWVRVGGTSLSAPAWAGILALADQGRASAGKPTLGTAGPAEAQAALYAAPAGDYRGVTGGTNGYAATPGYNLVGGLGTPVYGRLLADLTAFDGGPMSDSSAGRRPLIAAGMVFDASLFGNPGDSGDAQADALLNGLAGYASAVVGGDSAPTTPSPGKPTGMRAGLSVRPVGGDSPQAGIDFPDGGSAGPNWAEFEPIHVETNTEGSASGLRDTQSASFGSGTRVPGDSRREVTARANVWSGDDDSEWIFHGVATNKSIPAAGGRAELDASETQ